ncbi:MAG: NAD(P)H-dependent oxidoreductase [Actinomycetota bacterium]
MSDAPLEFVAVIGSLRAASFHRAVFDAAVELVPEGVTLREVPVAEVPFYNGDVEDAGDPPPVAELKAMVANADGLGSRSILHVIKLQHHTDKRIRVHQIIEARVDDPEVPGTRLAEVELLVLRFEPRVVTVVADVLGVVDGPTGQRQTGVRLTGLQQARAEFVAFRIPRFQRDF